MPSTYKLGPGTIIETTEDGTVLTFRYDPNTPDGKLNQQAGIYRVWLAAGNTPSPADPLPLVFSAGQQLPSQRVRTTNATATQIFSFTIPVATEWTATLTMRGITDDMLNLRVIKAELTVARGPTGGAVFIPARTGGANVDIRFDRAIGTAGAWPLPSVTVVGNDVIIKVTGAAGTGINWLLTGSYETFTPGGS